MHNPYEAPTPVPERKPEPGKLPPQEPGLAGQIRVVAVLMMVQGSFEVLFGAMFMVMAFLFPAAFGAMVAAESQARAQPGPDPEAAARVMMVIYLVMGLGGVIPGLLHLLAGFRNAQYRGRSLGIAALGLGLATLPIFICLPSALLLAIYGMIIYLDKSSVAVFEMGEQRFSAEAIYSTFFAGRAAAPPKPLGPI